MNIHFDQPIFFKRNRVFRIYKGGLLFSDFFGDAKEDNNYPEEWVASTVNAINPNQTDPKEGLSVIENTELTLKEVAAAHPDEMYGPRGSFSVLVKLLDSAVRLQLQVHPNQEFARKFFHSEFGKTEMWIILATRKDACIYFGFKDTVTKEALTKQIDKSKADKHAMENYLNRIPVSPGDVFLIPSTCVHAIGAGCLLLEVQEPTDFTIQPEAWAGEYRLTDEEMYLGLSQSDALDCFDYTLCGPESLKRSRKIPKLISNENGVKKELLMSYEDTPCFCVHRYTVKGGYIIPDCAPAIYIVTEGSGTIKSDNYKRQICKGDYFFLPYAANGKCSIVSENIEIIECLPALVK